MAFLRQRRSEPSVTSAPDVEAQDAAGSPLRPRGRPGLVVTASLVTGIVAALLLVAAPFVPVQESAITGALLCGFALGWTALLLLSQRFTERPQRWAAAPAVFLGLGGLLLLVFGSPMREVLSWVWPPALLALVVWMVVRVHRDLRSRGGRIQIYLVAGVMGLCAVGGGWQTVREATDTDPYLGSGRLVDVGGYRLRLDCAGSGSPTVVLEPGAGGTSASMGWIAPVVAKQTRVCVYDRAGRGGSQTPDRPQDGARIATDLHTLLHRAGVRGPYVLAGHSFGGLYVRTFAAHYPHEVSGLVLIDSTASSEPAASVVPDTGGRSSYDAVGRASVLASLTARVGLTRLYGELAGGSLPAGSEQQLRFDAAQAGSVRSTAEEYLRAGASSREAASLRDLGDKPLVVLTAAVGHDSSWMSAQDRTTRLSTNSVHRVVAGATHQALLDDRQYAEDTTRAILEVVGSSRTGRPLRP